MLPLSDGLHPRRFPIVNVALIAANFAVWLLYELPHLGSAVYHASFYPCTVDNACSGPGAVGDQLVHRDVHARELGPHPRQHALPRHLRQERRGRVRTPPLPRLLHRRRLRRDDDANRGHPALRHGGSRTRPESRRQRRDRRRARRLHRPLPDRADPHAGARLLRQDPRLGLPRRLVRLPARRGHTPASPRHRRTAAASRSSRTSAASSSAPLVTLVPAQRRAAWLRRARPRAACARASTDDADATSPSASAKATAAALAVVALAVGIWQVRSVLILLLLALTFAAAIRPGVDWLSRHRVPQSVAILLHFLVVGGAVALLLWLAVPPALHQIGHALGHDAIAGTAARQTTGIGDRALAWLQHHLASAPDGDGASPPGRDVRTQGGRGRRRGLLHARRHVVLRLRARLDHRAAHLARTRGEAREGARDVPRARPPARCVHAAPLPDGLRGRRGPLGRLLRHRPRLLAARRRLRRPDRDRAADRPGHRLDPRPRRRPPAVPARRRPLAALAGRRARVPELRRQPEDREDGRALAARDAALRRGRRSALRRLRRDPRRAVHLGSCDTDRRARARSRPARRRSSAAGRGSVAPDDAGRRAGRGAAAAARALRQSRGPAAARRHAPGSPAGASAASTSPR